MNDKSIEIKETSKYWKDESTDNKLSKSKYTFEQAQEILKQLQENNCSRCEDCTDCVDCVECKNCQKCTKCDGCEDCSFCSGCINSNGCDDCSDCKYCKNCEECIECEFCYDSQECEKCDDCYYCKKSKGCVECTRCESCTNCKGCEDISYESDKSEEKNSIENEEEGLAYFFNTVYAFIFIGLALYFVLHKGMEFEALGKLSLVIPIFIFFAGGLSMILPEGDEEFLINGNSSSLNIIIGMILTAVSFFGLSKLGFFSKEFLINGTMFLFFSGYFIVSFITNNKLIGYAHSFYGLYFKTLWMMILCSFFAGFIIRIGSYIIDLFKIVV